MIAEVYFNLFGIWAFFALILLNGICTLKCISLPNESPKKLRDVCIIIAYGVLQLAFAYFIFTAGIKKLTGQKDILYVWRLLGIIACFISMAIRPNTVNKVTGGRPKSGAPFILFENSRWENWYQKLLILILFITFPRYLSQRILMFFLFFIIIFILNYERNRLDHNA